MLLLQEGPSSWPPAVSPPPAPTAAAHGLCYSPWWLRGVHTGPRTTERGLFHLSGAFIPARVEPTVRKVLPQMNGPHAEPRQEERRRGGNAKWKHELSGAQVGTVNEQFRCKSGLCFALYM